MSAHQAKSQTQFEATFVPAEVVETVDATDALLFEDERRLQEQVRHFVAFASRNEPTLAAQLRPILNVSGKRVRPLFPFWLLRAVGAEQDAAKVDAIARVAAVTLVLHSAAIVIDDIEDESVERQSQASLHVRNGIGPTLNSASYLIFAALEYLGHDAELLKLTVEAVARCHEGQALDLAFGDPQVAGRLFAASADEREQRWVTCTRFKTSMLMELSVRSAAHILGLPTSQVEEIAAAIVEYGIGYQILDDVKNFRPDLLGKKAYEDLPRGLRNWVCLELIRTLSREDRYYARTIYGSDVFSTFVRMHPGLAAAKERATSDGKACMVSAQRLLLTATGGKHLEYLGRLFGRPIEDLAGDVDAQGEDAHA